MDLYISDLDGTLLDSSGKLSQYTIKSINQLIADGLHFTIATARGIDSVQKILEPLNIKLPVILNNGLFIHDLKSNKILSNHSIEKNIALEIWNLLLSFGIESIIRVKENNTIKLYYRNIENEFVRDFINSKKESKIIQCVKSKKIKYDETRVLNIFTIGKKEQLKDVAKFLRSHYNMGTDFYKDSYNDSYWLEINPLKATKGEGALILKEDFKFSKIISFGDNLNDLSMFHVSDRSYGMINGNLNIREHVSKIIGTNDENSVVKEIEYVFLGGNNQYRRIS